MTEQNFKIHMGFMCAYFGKEIQPEIMGLYWSMLKHLSDEEFQLAIKNVCAEFAPTSACPFPLVSHILKHCGQSGDAKAVAAIDRLKKALRYGPYQSVSFDDPALHYVIQVNGGWSVLCNWSGKEWDVNEGRLIESYKSSVMANKAGPDHMAGISERNEGWFTLHVLPPQGWSKQIPCKGNVPAICFNPSGFISRKDVSKIGQLESIGSILTHIGGN